MRRILSILALLSILAPLPASAFNATSTNYYIRQNIQSTSGGNSTYSFSTSTTYKLISAGGQTANGTSTPGTNYTLWGGFLRNMFKSVKPVYSIEHYHWRADDGSETTATAAIAEDTATTSVTENITQRLRIALSNEGGTEAQYATQQPRLEYGLKVSTCSAIVSWTDVAAVGGDWDMSNTANLTNGGDTTNISTAVGGVTDPNKTFISDNNAILDTASAPSALLISSDSFMELEYAILANTAATDGGTYCFRLTNAGTATLYTPTIYPEATIAGGNSLPVASAVSIDSGASSVTLTENTTKNVVCSGTVTDNDGYANISAVGAFLYRTSVGTTSASDNNNLYRLYGDSQCVPSGGTGLSETYTCTFPVQYYADATDSGSAYVSDDWTCGMYPRDTVATGTPATDTIEMASLAALDVTTTIPYGSVDANTDTGSSNQQTVVTNTGNREMDPQVSGTSMTGSGTITSSQQKYLASAFTYTSSGTTLSGTPTTVNLDLPRRTDDSNGYVAPTFQSSSNATDGADVVCAKPTGTASGDLLVALVDAYDDNTVTVAPPAGWSTQSGPDRRTTGNLITSYVFYKIAGGSEPSTYTFDDTPDKYTNCIILRYSGADPATPLLAATSTNNGTVTTRTGTGITTTRDNSVLLFFSVGYSGGLPGDSEPTGMTMRDTVDGVTAVYDQVITTAGATGNRTHVQNTSDSWVTTMFAINPPASGGGIISDILYWGLGVPNGTPNGSYTGTNTFTAAAVDESPPGIAIEQTMAKVSAANVASSNGSFSSTPAAGNTVIVMISGWQDPTGYAPGTISDNQGNTYQLAAENGCDGGPGNHLCYAGIYYAENISSSGTFTITVDPPNTGNYIEWQAIEVSGLATSGAKDKTTSDSGGGIASDAAVGPTAATTVADELVIAVTSVSQSDTNLNITTPSGYTQIGLNNDANATIGYQSSYKIISSTGTQSASWSHDNNTSNDEWAAAIATFK